MKTLVEKKRRRLSGLKKATILLRILGKSLTNQVAKHLSTAEKRKIKAYSSEVSSISIREEYVVLRDFTNYFKMLDNQIKTSNPVIWIFEIMMLLSVVLIISAAFFLISKQVLVGKPVEVPLKQFFNANGIYLLIFPLVTFLTQVYDGHGALKLITTNIKKFLHVLSGIGCGILIFGMLAFSIVSSPYVPVVKPTGIYLVVFILSTSILGPIIEEIFFRKWIFTNLKKYTGLVLSVIITSLGFAVLHGFYSLSFFVVAFLSGVLLTILYHKTESLLPSFIAHSLGNTGSILLLLLFDNKFY